MKKILICFGTRPEAIKMAPLFLKFKEDEVFNVKLCVTGQHREMLDQVLEVFDVVPDFDLNIMKEGQTLSEITSEVINGMQNIYASFKPDMVFVHGDTATTLSISLSAFYNKIAISHIEAGLRTFNLQSPWPEEANRKLTSVITNLHFCPTEISKNNLIREGYSSENIYVTGNTVIDSLLLVRNKLNNNSIKSKFMERFNFLDSTKKMVLITGHRRENFGQGFKNICTALKALASQFPNYIFVYPVHLNPSVRGVVFDSLSSSKNIFLIEPQDYEAFIFLMEHSYIILTDSGGIQEEAPSLNKPVLVMRDTTERPEGIDSGTLKLVGTSANSIINECYKLLTDQEAYEKMSKRDNPYGDGLASVRIVDIVKKNLTHKEDHKMLHV